MLATAGAILGMSIKVIAYGSLLGVGFWVGRKITNQADTYLALWDKRLMEDMKLWHKEFGPKPLVVVN